MKKILLSLVFACSLVIFAKAETDPYSLDEVNIEALFASAQEVGLDNASLLSDFNLNTVVGSSVANVTVGGFLVRAFFCGFVALHRSYAGTGGKKLWWMYLCIPVVGQVNVFVDFWWVVFKGESALSKYQNNGKYIVWIE